jgi:hypothetical protein
MAFNFLKLARALATASLVSGAGAAWANTSVTNTASATLRINPYTIDASYNKSNSAAIQGNGIAGVVNTTENADSLSRLTSSMSDTLPTGTGNSSNKLGGQQAGLVSVIGGMAVLADFYKTTDASGTFSLDISAKSADLQTSLNTIKAPGTLDANGNMGTGVNVSGASKYQIQQMGSAGMAAEVISPTKVTLNAEAAKGGSTGMISLETRAVSNGVQETYRTVGSVSVDAASASIEANTTNHIGVNAVNAKPVGKVNDLIAVSNNTILDLGNGNTAFIQAPTLADADYQALDSTKGATSIKLTVDPADSMRRVKDEITYLPSTQTTTTSGEVNTTCGTFGWMWWYRSCSTTYTSPTSVTTVTQQPIIAKRSEDNVPTVNIKNGDISLPNYSSQTISSAGTTWADVGGTSATGGTRANGTTVSKVEINSAAGGKRADNTTQNTIAAGGFGNTVQMSTTFDMTVFGK